LIGVLALSVCVTAAVGPHAVDGRQQLVVDRDRDALHARPANWLSVLVKTWKPGEQGLLEARAARAVRGTLTGHVKGGASGPDAIRCTASDFGSEAWMNSAWSGGRVRYHASGPGERVVREVPNRPAGPGAKRLPEVVQCQVHPSIERVEPTR
jgi:hypothetical protein